MNPICSFSIIRYNSTLPQEVVRKEIRYNLYWIVSCVNIMIRYKMLPKLLTVVSQDNFCYAPDHILTRNNVTGLVFRICVNTHTPDCFLYWIHKNVDRLTAMEITRNDRKTRKSQTFCRDIFQCKLFFIDM